MWVIFWWNKRSPERKNEEEEGKGEAMGGRRREEALAEGKRVVGWLRAEEGQCKAGDKEVCKAMAGA